MKLRQAIPLDWRQITPSNHPKFLVKGTQLNYALYDNSRFKIVEYRVYDNTGYADRAYAIYDAATVTMEQVKAGIEPKLVGRFADLDEVENFLRKAKNTA